MVCEHVADVKRHGKEHSLLVMRFTTRRTLVSEPSGIAKEREGVGDEES
jgi:hypothetical protein